jgi:catechol-2,3-dioxygenase
MTGPLATPAAADTANGVLRPAFHHVNLKTTMENLDAMIAWYGLTVGAELVFRYPFGAWLTNDVSNHRIALLAFPQFRDDHDRELEVGLHHVAFEYATIDGLLESYLRLRDVGVTPFLCFDHGMTTSFYYYDPDRNALELQVDNHGSWEASKHWMRTAPAFHENPLGVFVDPEPMIAARADGASFEDLHARAYSGEFLPDPIPDIPMPEGAFRPEVG